MKHLLSPCYIQDAVWGPWMIPRWLGGQSFKRHTFFCRWWAYMLLIIMQGKHAKGSKNETDKVPWEGRRENALIQTSGTGNGDLDFTQAERNEGSRGGRSTFQISRNNSQRLCVIWKFMVSLENSQVIWYDLCKVTVGDGRKHSVHQYSLYVLAFPFRFLKHKSSCCQFIYMVDSLSSEFKSWAHPVIQPECQKQHWIRNPENWVSVMAQLLSSCDLG